MAKTRYFIMLITAREIVVRKVTMERPMIMRIFYQNKDYLLELISSKPKKILENFTTLSY